MDGDFFPYKLVAGRKILVTERGSSWRGVDKHGIRGELDALGRQIRITFVRMTRHELDHPTAAKHPVGNFRARRRQQSRLRQAAVMVKMRIASH
jgi:hypothetical protein